MNDTQMINDVLVLFGLTVPFGIAFVKYFRKQYQLSSQLNNIDHAASIIQTKDIHFLSNEALTLDSFHKKNINCKQWQKYFSIVLDQGRLPFGL